MAAKTPTHITMKLDGDLPSLRTPGVWLVLTEVMASFHRAQGGLRICQFSVQDDHLHLICESADAGAVSRGMVSLATRIARRLNAFWGRAGRVFADRYHREDLTSLRQIRNAVRYVLGNSYKHITGLVSHVGRNNAARPDPYSSGAWFDGYRERALDRAPLGGVARCTEPPQFWSLAHGWITKHGPISVLDGPQSC